MVMRPITVVRFQIRFDGILASGGVALQFTAGAQALVGLDMRAGRDLLQEDFDRFVAFVAFEGEYAGRLEHDDGLCAAVRWKRAFYHRGWTAAVN